MPRFKSRDMGTNLRFDGVAPSGITMTASFAITSAFTLACWFKKGRNATSEMLVGHPTATSKIGFFNSKWFIRILDAGSSDNTIVEPPAGDWHFVVVTRDLSNIVKISIDGAASQTLFSGAAQSGDFPVGRIARSETGQHFLGNMDEVRMWATAFTDTQIADLYYRNVVPAGGLFLEYLLNEGAGTTATDTSVTGNNGTISGGVYSSEAAIEERPADSGRVSTSGRITVSGRSSL